MNKNSKTPPYPYERSADQDGEAIAHHKVVIIGAGPVGLAAAIDLAQNDIPVLVLDDADNVSAGSRAISFSKRTLEILDRLGCGDGLVEKGVKWDQGKVFFGTHEVCNSSMPDEEGDKRPPFINLQQYYLEEFLLNRLRELQSLGKPVQLRGKNKVSAIGAHEQSAILEIDTPEGPYNIESDWVIACDGANSATRQMMGLEFAGRVFEDHFLIVDITMQADFPAERRFWFDPPFNPGQSALLQKQPDNMWRIDFQLGKDIDRRKELKPENIDKRLRAMLGDTIEYTLKWSAVHMFQCRHMAQFHKGRVIFAGDAAHQVSPFGARGANSGLQDADNLIWKLKLILKGTAPETLIDSYDDERIYAAKENVLCATRSTEFITPKSDVSRIFRDAVLDLSTTYDFARPLVNSGRPSTPCTYDGLALNSADGLNGPAQSRPGSACPDAPLGTDFLLDKLGGHFILLTIDADAPDSIEEGGVIVSRLALSAKDDKSGALRRRYLGNAPSAVYLIRPDQHIAARRSSYNENLIRAAIRRATGKE